jgi:hypothetical protein
MMDLSSRAGRLGVLGSAIRVTASALRRARTSNSDVDWIVSAPGPKEIRAEGLADPLLEVARLSRVEQYVVERCSGATLIARRRANYSSLVGALSSIPNARPLFEDCAEQSAPYVLPLLVRDPDLVYHRMRQKELPVYRWDRLWPGTPDIEGDAAKAWTHGIIQVSCNQSLRDDDVVLLADGIRECL